MYTATYEIENSHELQTALVHFIVNRADGDMLRDIAIRTLKDLNAKDERSYYGNEELKAERLNRQKEALKANKVTEVTRREINVYTRKNLIKLRKQTFLGQKLFSRSINLSYETYRHYERGKIVVPIDVAVNVCGAFNIPLEKFLTQSI
jgi:DNA-binding XRE family transcriptional regulator